jgi:hypothetical protein
MKGRRSNMHNSIDSNDGVLMTEEEVQLRPPVLPQKKMNVPQLKLTLNNHQKQPIISARAQRESSIEGQPQFFNPI